MLKPIEEYRKFQDAFDFFNDALFAGRLPPCLITLQRTRHTRGYYAPYRFAARHNRTLRTDEIALNPETFAGRSDKEILSTLVHEQAHLWQATEGKPGRRGYHNREWARKMLEIGVRPVSLDDPDKMTGRAVTHVILPGGRFDLAADRLLATGFRLKWQDSFGTAGNDDGHMPVEKKRNKVKYSCPACEQNAWAKPAARLVCGWCEERMERMG